jgi:hypothetical protein
MEEKELSPLARQLLGHANVMPMFTQKEFDRELAQAKAEIMAIAIQTTRQAIAIEREECARLAEECVDIEKLPDQIRQRLSGKPH